MRKETLILVRCENIHEQGGKKGYIILTICIDGHWYTFPPTPFILAAKDGFRERNPDAAYEYWTTLCPECEGGENHD